MKKALIILALALFVGGIGAPAIAANNSNFSQIELREDEPKKKEKKSETSDKKTESTEKKSGDCSSTCGGEKKSSDCTKK